MLKEPILNFKEVNSKMEMMKKSIISLMIVVLMLASIMPVMVNATEITTEETELTQEDKEPTEPELPPEYDNAYFENLEKDTELKFKGKVFRPLDYSCRMSARGNYPESKYPEGKEATFLKVNKLFGKVYSITIKVDKKSFTIKPEQVVSVNKKEDSGEARYTIDDMKLNTIVYFEGPAYGSMDYSCIRGVKDNFTEKTAGIVWKINKLYGNKSITVQLSNGKFRTIPIEQVTYESQRKYMSVDCSSLKETLDGNLYLGIAFDGENTQVKLDTSTIAKLDISKDSIILGNDSGFCTLTITEKGKEDEPIELHIIKDSKGEIKLDFANAKISAEAEAELLETIKAGGKAHVSVKDGNIEVHAEGKVDETKNGTNIVNGEATASYDINKRNDEDNDINAGAKLNVLGKNIINKEKTNTRIIKTIKSLISRFRKR